MKRLVRNMCLLLLPGMLCLVAGTRAIAQNSRPVIRFSSFDAAIFNKNAVQLKWETAGVPLDDIYFIVERSVDGITFQPLHKAMLLTAQGAGNYQYTDHFALTDSVFYRVAGVTKMAKPPFPKSVRYSSPGSLKPKW